MDDLEIGVPFPAGAEMFFFSTAFRPTPGHIHPPVKWAPGPTLSRN
jgi:hypothetical protein